MIETAHEERKAIDKSLPKNCNRLKMSDIVRTRHVLESFSFIIHCCFGDPAPSTQCSFIQSTNRLGFRQIWKSVPHFKIATYEQQRHPSKLRKTLNQSQIQKYTKQGLYQLTVGNTDLILLGVFFSGGHF